MTAAATRPPFIDASPAEIRAALIDEERPEFERQWRAALTNAAETLSLDAVYQTLQCWRRIAWMTQADPEVHRRMLVTAGQVLRTGEHSAGSVPAEDVRALVRERLGRQVYRVETDTEAMHQIAALPDEALASYVQVLDVLELTPWNGEPYNQDNPPGAMRVLPFGPHGEGMAVYLILEDQRRVDVLRVFWSG